MAWGSGISSVKYAFKSFRKSFFLNKNFIIFDQLLLSPRPPAYGGFATDLGEILNKVKLENEKNK